MFKTVEDVLPNEFVEHVKYCATKHFGHLDFSNTDLTRYWMLPNSGGYNHLKDILLFGEGIITKPFKDREFVILHELRHAHQTKTKMLDVRWNDGHTDVLFKWRSEKPMTNDEIDRLGTIKYFQLPWEADANGFAHHAMGMYIPKDPVSFESIRYMTTPAEFLYKQYA